MATPNRFKVPLKAWTKFGEVGRFVFNDTYDALRNNQSTVAPPLAQKVPASSWKVVAWNAAWLAADACRRYTKGQIA